MKGPAPRPCESCPYRRDVPSGIWDASEYAKLPAYDAETFDQPHGLFQCHQKPAGAEDARPCAGWVAVHGPDLLALRIAVTTNRLDRDVMEYTTDVPLWPTGKAAAEHGMADIEWPAAAAVRTIRKVAARLGLTE